jgi:hypothetical protein
MLKSLILALALLAQTAPTIKWMEARKEFLVQYPAGAAWACVVFRMVEATETDNENWPDGHYAPRSCGEVSPTSTYFLEAWSPYIKDPKTGKDYNVEWDVYTIIQYPEKGRTDAFTEVETNKVRVKR